MTRLIVAVLLCALLAACAAPAAQQPISPLPLPPQAVSPLPAGDGRTLVLVKPRGFVPFVATASAATVEDECSANAQAAWMLSLIRRAAWQRRAEVRCHPVLVAAAQSKADEMARLIYASHTSPTGAGPNDNVRAHGYELPEWYGSGPEANNVESFAAGFPYSAPEIVLAAWQTSPSHWQHVAALHPFFVGQECAAVGYSHTPGGFYHYWVFLSAPCA